MNHDVASDRGEDQEQEITHIESVEIEVPNEVKKRRTNLTFNIYIFCYVRPLIDNY
jgi:hypothetical protein